MRFKEFMAGFRCHLRGHRLIREHRLWRFIVIPGMMSILYFPVVVWLLLKGMKPVTGYLHEKWVPEFLQSGFTHFLLWLVACVLGIYAGFLMFRNVIMVICSPLLSHISEIVEKVSGGIEPPKFTWKGTGREVMRAAALSGISLSISAVVFVFCFFVGIIPILGTAVAFCVMSLVQMYMAGIGFSDPALERRRFTVRSTLRFARKHRPRLMGVGLGFLLLLGIPVIGWFIAPGYGIVAGTLATLDLLAEEDANFRKPSVIP